MPATGAGMTKRRTMRRADTPSPIQYLHLGDLVHADALHHARAARLQRADGEVAERRLRAPRCPEHLALEPGGHLVAAGHIARRLGAAEDALGADDPDPRIRNAGADG